MVRPVHPDEEVVIPEQEATQGMPIVGETVHMAGILYRCVMVAYADEKETGGAPEIRVKFKAMKG